MLMALQTTPDSPEVVAPTKIPSPQLQEVLEPAELHIKVATEVVLVVEVEAAPGALVLLHLRATPLVELVSLVQSREPPLITAAAAEAAVTQTHPEPEEMVAVAQEA